MVQARLAGCISDCVCGAPKGDRRGVLLWPPGFDPGSEGVEQVRNLDSHISHNFQQLTAGISAQLLPHAGHHGMRAK